MWVNFEFCIYCHPVNSNLQHDPTHTFTKDNFFVNSLLQVRILNIIK